MHISIAIDGPSGAGKSSVAKELATRLDIIHLDTGAMYRAFALQVMEEGIDPCDEQALTWLTQITTLAVSFKGGVQQTLINGKDISDRLRTPGIDMVASSIAKFANVRRFMVRMQQELAAGNSMIIDGRDIGEIVLPEATLKVFLTASSQVRAKRRYDELSERGESVRYDDILEDVIQRDLQDSTRIITPFRPAADAKVVDSSSLTQAEVVEVIEQLLYERLEGKDNL